MKSVEKGRRGQVLWPRARLPLPPLIVRLIIAMIIGASPLVGLAQKKPKKALKDNDARRLIIEMPGFALKKSAVKVKDVSPAGVIPVTVAAAVTIAFRFEQVEDEPGNIPSILKRKRWRAIEFRTGDRNWERVDLMVGQLQNETVERARAELEQLVTDFETRLHEQKITEPFSRGALTIKQLSPLGSSAVAEIMFDASFRLSKDTRGKWIVDEIALGENGSVNLLGMLQTFNRQKESRAREEMQMIKAALEAFRRERGFYVAADSEVVLMDHLSPRFIERIIRIDPWGRPYRYEGLRDRFVLRSDGADGLRDTTDDVTVGSG